MDKPKPLSALDEEGEDEEATKKNEMKEFILKATICHLKVCSQTLGLILLKA